MPGSRHRKLTRRRGTIGALVLTPLLALGAAAAAGAVKTDEQGAASVPSVGHSWGKPGPYEVKTSTEAVHTLYYPANMGQSGEHHPVVIWGNGTGAVPAVYGSLLRHWAGQGFIVVAANTPNSNFALEMLAGIDLLEKRNADSGSPFHNKIDLEHIASAGHSQGGSAAINAAADDRVDTAIPIQPGPLADAGRMDEPVFYLAGQRDLTVPPPMVKGFYDDSGHVPAVYGEVSGAGHLSSIADGGDFRAPTTAWLRYWLMGDEKARSEFFGPNCGYCADPKLSDFQRNAKAQEIPGT